MTDHQGRSIVGIVPARGGSKGIPNKNLIKIDGETLVNRAVKSCIDSKYIDHVVVSSDSETILESLKDGVIGIKRPDEFATDESPIQNSFVHALAELLKTDICPEILVWLQPNIPIRDKGIVDQVCEALLSNAQADSAVTCFQFDPRFRWSKILNEDGFLVPLFEKKKRAFRRQNLTPSFLIDGSVLAFLSKNLLDERRMLHTYLGENIAPVFQRDSIFSLELDEIPDLKRLYEYLFTDNLTDEKLMDYFLCAED